VADSPDVTGAPPTFELRRTFRVPLERMWGAWSEADRFGRWWGPKGCRVAVRTFEFRAGGLVHYSMLFDGAPPMWGRFVYRDIARLDRIVWLNGFANDRGGIARAPFAGLCPLEVENTVRFTEAAGVTTVHLHTAPFGATPAEAGFFAELCASGSLEQGYGGTFDQLAAHLACA
jgi:uncharacterized protein YndB with AHSA1/START domain